MATATIVVSSTVITAPSITTAESRSRAGSNAPYGVSLMPYTVSRFRYGVRLDWWRCRTVPRPSSHGARLRPNSGARADA